MRYGLILLAAGVAVLLMSEAGEWAALRMLAVVLLVGGAIAAGIAGGAHPQSAAYIKRVGAIFSRNAMCAVAILLTAPALAVLAASLYGALVRLTSSNAAGDAPLLILGGVVALILLALASTVVVLGTGAIRGKTPQQPTEKQA
jgi:hypothetical protein